MNTSIVVPPPCDVHGIVLDMLPSISDLDDETLKLSVSMATCLVSLCETAKRNKVVEQVFAQFFQGMLQRDPRPGSVIEQESQRLEN